jgi:hypothetical protein
VSKAADAQNGAGYHSSKLQQEAKGFLTGFLDEYGNGVVDVLHFDVLLSLL